MCVSTHTHKHTQSSKALCELDVVFLCICSFMCEVLLRHVGNGPHHRTAILGAECCGAVVVNVVVFNHCGKSFGTLRHFGPQSPNGRLGSGELGRGN